MECMENDLRTFAHSQSSLQTVEGLGEQGQPKKDFLEALHTDAKSQFLSENSILMKSTPTMIMNFPAKNGIIENLIFWTKIRILPQCALGPV